MEEPLAATIRWAFHTAVTDVVDVTSADAGELV